MPDMPDGFKSNPLGSIQSVGDLGELGPRLGSFITINRTGSVIWETDFSNGFTDVDTNVALPSPLLTLDSTKSFMSGYSAKLSTSPLNGTVAQCYKTISKVGGGKIGFGAVVRFDDVRSKFRFQANYTFDGNLYAVDGSLDLAGGKITIEDPVLGTVDILDIDFAAIYVNLWFVFKCVIDTDKGVYDHFEFGDQRVSTRNANVGIAFPSDNPYIQYYLQLQTPAGLSSIAYLSAMWLTFGEP